MRFLDKEEVGIVFKDAFNERNCNGPDLSSIFQWVALNGTLYHDNHGQTLAMFQIELEDSKGAKGILTVVARHQDSQVKPGWRIVDIRLSTKDGKNLESPIDEDSGIRIGDDPLTLYPVENSPGEYVTESDPGRSLDGALRVKVAPLKCGKVKTFYKKVRKEETTEFKLEQTIEFQKDEINRLHSEVKSLKDTIETLQRELQSAKRPENKNVVVSEKNVDYKNLYKDLLKWIEDEKNPLKLSNKKLYKEIKLRGDRLDFLEALNNKPSKQPFKVTSLDLSEEEIQDIIQNASLGLDGWEIQSDLGNLDGWIEQ